MYSDFVQVIKLTNQRLNLLINLQPEVDHVQTCCMLTSMLTSNDRCSTARRFVTGSRRVWLVGLAS